MNLVRGGREGLFAGMPREKSLLWGGASSLSIEGESLASKKEKTSVKGDSLLRTGVKEDFSRGGKGNGENS